eukprot:835925_1
MSSYQRSCGNSETSSLVEGSGEIGEEDVRVLFKTTGDLVKLWTPVRVMRIQCVLELIFECDQSPLIDFATRLQQAIKHAQSWDAVDLARAHMMCARFARGIALMKRLEMLKRVERHLTEPADLIELRLSLIHLELLNE